MPNIINHIRSKLQILLLVATFGGSCKVRGNRKKKNKCTWLKRIRLKARFRRSFSSPSRPFQPIPYSLMPLWKCCQGQAGITCSVTQHVCFQLQYHKYANNLFLKQIIRLNRITNIAVFTEFENCLKSTSF